MWLTAPEADSARPGETIVRVTAKGDDRIHTGQLHPSGIGVLRYREGEEFACPAELAETMEIYLQRGWVVAAGTRVPARETAHAIDHEAISRLLRRSVRDPKTGCLVWQGAKMSNGYGNITYRRQLGLTHRLAWFAHHGPIPAGHCICHACDNRGCVEISHLFLGTPRDNYHDMKRKGRVVHRSKLKQPDVAAIKRRLASGETTGAIARDYAVLPKQIRRIETGRSWKDATYDAPAQPPVRPPPASTD